MNVQLPYLQVSTSYRKMTFVWHRKMLKIKLGRFPAVDSRRLSISSTFSGDLIVYLNAVRKEPVLVLFVRAKHVMILPTERLQPIPS